MNFDDELDSECFRGPVWVPDISQPGSLEKAYLNLGKVPADGVGDAADIAYSGAFLEDLFGPG